MAHMRWSQNQRGNPAWAAKMLEAANMVAAPARLDPTQFVDQGGLMVTVGVAGAAQNAVTVPVTITSPLANFITVGIGTNPVIPSGTVLYFGGAKVATLTADAYLGDVSIAVAALPTALVSTDKASYSRDNGIFVPSGTIVGRTLTERNAGTPWGPGDVATPDAELYLTAFDVVNARVNPDTVLVKHNFEVKENYLPNYGTLTTPQLTWLRANYACIVGQD